MSRAPRLVAALCAVSLVAAACGGDDDADVTTPVDDATTTTATATTVTTEPAPETTQPETTQPDTTQPDTTQPDTTQPDTTQPDTTQPAPDIVSIVDVAAAADDLTVLVSAIEVTGLAPDLATREYTVLAPTDAAFEALGSETVDAWFADPDALREILLNHVLPLPQTTAEIGLFNNVLALSGASWVITTGEPFQIGDAAVVAADIEADNGYIHVIDTVLVVPEADDQD